LRPISVRKLENRARQELGRRTRAVVVGLLILAIFSVVLVVAPLFVLLAALIHWAMARRLQARGVLVPAAITDSSGNPAGFEHSGQAWANEGKMLQHVGEDEVAEAFGYAHQLALALGRFVPAVIVHYSFESRGRTYRVGKYMFSDEAFQTDDEGKMWALVDPAYPRFNHWLVTSRRA
jgi:hypothetical protein